MTFVCPHCQRTLPEAAEPPRFCSYCGQRLRDSSEPQGGNTTVAFTPPPEKGTPEETPTQIGGFRILRKIGEGGMGRVFEAEPLAGGEHVAVKILSARLQANPTSVERFRQEGRLAGQIAHPRCVFVMAADADHGRPYIVMELMPGHTLKELLDERGTIPPVEAIRLILDVIEGLQEAHRLGVIHRDVKPSNCFLLPDGRVKVGDFGLSKSLGTAAQLTQSGAFLGTILYASPEQIKGEPVDFASDVYSVCATLYHLLAGRAPFHHEHATAALAKIISEDPPAIRTINPKVPLDLAKVVHRGLERDRTKRYASLNELHVALSALIPEQLSYGAMGIRIGAYLLDEIIVRVVFVAGLAFLVRHLTSWTWLQNAVPLIVFPLYYAILEGLYGQSWGKRLLGLRVCRQGTTSPPGFKRAILRTLIFYVLITVTLAEVGLFFSKINDGQLLRGMLFHLLPFIVGFLALVVPMRRWNDFRGLHEMLSGTCVLRLPQLPRPVKLVSQRANRLDLFPERPTEFPSVIGPFAVQRVQPLKTGYVVLAGDVILNRRVLMRVQPGEIVPPKPSTVARPGRLWPLGTGVLDVQGVRHTWEAYVAPSGAPLVDAVDPKQPIRWPEARPILEQLTEELTHTTVPEFALDQVWVQPDGRPQVLDFALSDQPKLDKVGVLRQATVLLLEGAARHAKDVGPIRSPLPKHAERLTARLARPGGYATLADVRAELVNTRGIPARLTLAARMTQVAVQGLLVATGLLAMFVLSGIYSVYEVMENPDYIARAKKVQSGERLLHMIATPEGRAKLAAEPAFAERMNDPNFVTRLGNRVEEDRMRLRGALPGLSALERFGLKVVESIPLEESVDALKEAATRAEEPTSTDDPVEEIKPAYDDWPEFCFQILMEPIIWVGFAFVFRGGLSYWLTGVVVASNRGGRATRRQCAVRAAIVWFPIGLLLCASVLVQTFTPENSPLYSALWWLALFMLPNFVILALVNIETGLHDRLAGTTLVPR